jgi:hypothetical protein
MARPPAERLGRCEPVPCTAPTDGMPIDPPPGSDSVGHSQCGSLLPNELTDAVRLLHEELEDVVE